MLVEHILIYARIHVLDFRFALPNVLRPLVGFDYLGVYLVLDSFVIIRVLIVGSGFLKGFVLLFKYS